MLMSLCFRIFIFVYFISYRYLLQYRNVCITTDSKPPCSDNVPLNTEVRAEHNPALIALNEACEKALVDMKSRKSEGIDRIPAGFLKTVSKGHKKNCLRYIMTRIGPLLEWSQCLQA